MEKDRQQDKNNNNNAVKHPDCMCRMCRVRRGDRPPLITSSHPDAHPTLNLTNDQFNEAYQYYMNENDSYTLPKNDLLSQDLNDLKKTLVKYTNDNKINLSTKQIEIFIKKIFEEIHKKYNITRRSRL